MTTFKNLRFHWTTLCAIILITTCARRVLSKTYSHEREGLGAAAAALQAGEVQASWRRQSYVKRSARVSAKDLSRAAADRIDWMALKLSDEQRASLRLVVESRLGYLASSAESMGKFIRLG
jgi:hypothetical protein